jgi:hypothetical protein
LNETYEVVKKDADGNKYTIRIYFRKGRLVIDDVGYTPKGKRKVTFLGAQLTNNYGWRALAWEGRGEAQKSEILKYTDESILLEALQEVWLSLKPAELQF